MKLSLKSSPHNHNMRDTGQVMRLVMYACVPGILVQTWFFGFGTLIQIALALTTALACEAFVTELRKKNTERTIKDCSALLAGLLLAISIPPFAPWWIIVIGTIFSIVIVKQLYGGLGYNMFNPAMAGYVVLLISFPVQMTSWLPPTSLAEQSHGFFDAVYIIFTGFTQSGFSIEQLRIGVDGTTMATPLDHVKTQISQGFTLTEAYANPIFSDLYGKGWAVLSLAYLLGGLFLIKTRVINWHIPASMIIATVLLSGFFHLIQLDVYASSIFHLVNGSLIIGAFFIATDPVSASTTAKGRIVFGAAIGCWIVIIRTWGAYPDAVAFAVLIMNMAVPLIDYYTQPRTYGHSKNKAALGKKAD